MEEEAETEFTTLMRMKTREVHNLSDALVQAKFVLGLIDDKVWAEGLLVFYEVFRFLEDHMEWLHDTNVGKFYNSDLLRTQYFEADLELYYGSNWKEENPTRECVRKYISHLEELEKIDSDLLIPYIYHLYLGLLSGGRILRRKQKLMSFSKFSTVSSVVDFDTPIVSQLKTFIKATMNEIVKSVSDETKNKLLEESINVFKLNCELIRSVNSASAAVNRLAKMALYASFVLVSISAVIIFWHMRNKENKDG